MKSSVSDARETERAADTCTDSTFDEVEQVVSNGLLSLNSVKISIMQPLALLRRSRQWNSNSARVVGTKNTATSI